MSNGSKLDSQEGEDHVQCSGGSGEGKVVLRHRKKSGDGRADRQSGTCSLSTQCLNWEEAVLCGPHPCRQPHGLTGTF